MAAAAATASGPLSTAVQPFWSRQTMRFFFDSVSIRGLSRITRSRDRFLRHLWGVFVFSTTIWLCVSVYKIIVDYLQFSVNIQTYQRSDDASPFPAVTFCNHQPFSKTAYSLWEAKEVTSPTEFNKHMRSSADQIMHSVLKNESFSFKYYYSVGVAWDKISVYYQNLPYTTAQKLGHDQSIIQNCMWMYGQTMGFDKRCQDEMWVVRNYSHHTFFNCITIQATQPSDKQITQLGMVIWLGPGEDYNIKHRQGFLFDIYQQAYGLRVVIHEPDTLPRVDENGIQIEPGKMNEINYQATRFKQVNSMKHPCFEDTAGLDVMPDLDNVYSYDRQLCLESGLQSIIVKECHCLYGYFPRFVKPNETLPYCGKVTLDNLNDFMDRAQCVQNVLNSQVQIKEVLKKTVCLPKCLNVGYDSTVSVTKWRATSWQLHWLSQSYERYNDLQEAIERNRSVEQKTEKMSEYFTKDNLTSDQGQEKLVFDDRFTFLVVKRRGNSTMVKEERLVLTISALFSRVGGLCSLFIGLSVSIFMELIEFFYLMCYKRIPLPVPASKAPKKISDEAAATTAAASAAAAAAGPESGNVHNTITSTASTHAEAIGMDPMKKMSYAVCVSELADENNIGMNDHDAYTAHDALLGEGDMGGE